MTTVFNANPYFDDFTESKNYQRILFRPGFNVQARELNQLQTALQAQIERFGNHVFTEGAIVLNAERFFDNRIKSIAYNGIVAQTAVGKVATGSTSGTTLIIKSVTASRIAYTELSGSGLIAGENLVYQNDLNVNITISTQNTPIQNAMIFSVNDGVMYVKGNFVFVESQTIVIDDSSIASSHSVGFNIIESIVTSDDDESLLDNAQGSPNFSAPGADRYKIELKLVRSDLGTTSEDYIEIARIVDGELVFVQERTIYSELEKEFARRTYDESGNYTVKPFQLSFENHKPTALVKPIISGGSITGYTVINSGDEFEEVPTITIVGDGIGAIATAIVDNKKLVAVNVVATGSGYTSGNTYVTVSGDPTKFTAKLEAGKAYVLGYEFETTSPSYITMDRARTTEFADNLDIQTFFGNYVNVSSMFGVFNTDTFPTVELHSVVCTSVNSATTLLGTAKVRFIDYVSGNVDLTTIYRMHLFDIAMTGAFESVQSIVIRSGATVLAGANINGLSKIGGTGQTFLSGTDRPSLIFPLNNQFVKELKDTNGSYQNEYTFKKVYTGVIFTSGVASIVTSDGQERFVGGTGTFSSDVVHENYMVIVTDKGSSSYTNGQVIPLTSIVGGAINNGVAHTITLTDGPHNLVATVIATINANTQSPRVKSLNPYLGVVVTTPNTVQNGFDSTGYSDVYKLGGVYRFASNPTGNYTVNPTTGVLTSSLPFTNVTANYRFDNGQRDDLYDHARIQLTGTAPAVGSFLVVVFNYFTTTGKGFSSVDSYSLPYTEIPSYTSTSTGVTYNLRDVLDFRPVRANNNTALLNSQLPHPQVQFQADYSYYVGRIDRIVATAGKSFAIKKGIPSGIPRVPTEEADGMTLYVVDIPPYTEKLSDISVKYIDNKRYTMQDIGRLETRIENLEYYTQLSLLEKQAADEEVVDSTGTEKFKNGFFVDSFTSADSLSNLLNPSAWSRQIWGWWNNRTGAASTWNKGVSRFYSSSVADSGNPDFKCAVDPIKSEMRPEVFTSFGDFTFNTGTGVKKTGKVVTLNYTEKTFISNPLASKSVNINPYDVIAFNGSLALSPSTDLWVDTNVLPTVNRIVDVQMPDAAATTNVNVTGRFSLGLLFNTTNVTTETRTNVVNTTTSNLGTNIVDVQYIPFARARDIIAIGSRFKPKTRLYPFFENIPFSSFVKPMTIVETSNNIGLFEEGETVQVRTGSISGPIVATATVAIYSPPATADNTKRLLSLYNIVGTLPSTFTNTFVTTATKNAAITSIVTYVYGDAIFPDEYGLVGVEIDLPANTIQTGSRRFRLVDNIDNDSIGSQSVGDAIYFAQGTLQSTQETILTTRSVQNQQVTTVTGFYYDPLAQTFVVDPRFYPSGAHISSVDVFFKTKSETIPVSLEITKTINGFPESIITSIPFALSEKLGSEVVVSEDGSVPTKFELDSPIHLVPGEYAIVLKANTQEYEVFVSEMGKTDIRTNQIISKQPYAGVLFKSQNASTWTPYQEEDLKFNLNIAEFQSSGFAEFDVTSIPEFEYSMMNLKTANIIPSGTAVAYSYKGTYPNGSVDSQWIPINTNTDTLLNTVKKANLAGSLKVRVDILSSDSAVSPVIDVEGMGAVLLDNNINNTAITPTDGEEVVIGGNALARYITKPVSLADGFESTNIQVTLDAFIPSGTDVRVYVKTSPTTSTAPFQSAQWKRLERRGTVTNSINEFDFKEMKFYPVGAYTSFGIPVDAPMPEFNIFAIKIVLVSANKSVAPKVRDLRAICFPV